MGWCGVAGASRDLDGALGTVLRRLASQRWTRPAVVIEQGSGTSGLLGTVTNPKSIETIIRVGLVYPGLQNWSLVSGASYDTCVQSDF